MAPKRSANQPSPAAVPPQAAAPSHSTTTAASQPTKAQNKPGSSSSKSSSSSAAPLRNAQDVQEIALGVWNKYVDTTPQRTKLLDAFMAFLVVVGVLQFVYCVIAGNFVRIAISHLRLLGTHGLTGWINDSLSMLSCRGSRLRLASLCSPRVCECRLTRTTRWSSRAGHMRGELAFSGARPFKVEQLLTMCRAFADFIFGSLLLHFFCVNFIN